MGLFMSRPTRAAIGQLVAATLERPLEGDDGVDVMETDPSDHGVPMVRGDIDFRDEEAFNRWLDQEIGTVRRSPVREEQRMDDGRVYDNFLSDELLDGGQDDDQTDDYGGFYDDVDDEEEEEEEGQEVPITPLPVACPPEPGEILQPPPRPQKKQKFGIRDQSLESPTRRVDGSPRPIIPDGLDDEEVPAFSNARRRLQFRACSSPKRKDSETALPYEGSEPATPARRQPRGRDITPDPSIRTPVSPNSGRRLPYNFRATTRPSRAPTSPLRTPAQAQPAPSTPCAPGRRARGRPAGVTKRGKKPGTKATKRFRCPNCKVEITLTPNGRPSARFKT
ncbi:hypothetical protein Tdes44962_MAKER00606 [Teratosphaeria destructans]|uniref:Uncharacterized protein n=1 Tax=Teratosphaeria destructans TaxID=418781 RepID=A0A9W7SN64_9PEZI|nr:hypothetical protein Tdes44962_MAKER00606 [Teratosphaeria destructans]